MHTRQTTKLVWTSLFALQLAWVAGVDQLSAVGQEFRIESQVYSDGSNMPVSQNITLFSEGIVYDFQLSNDAQPKAVEIIIFDTRQRNIVLLDQQRKIRMQIPDLQLMKIVDGVRRATVQDTRSSFLVEDLFREDVDLSTHWVTMTSPQIEYRFHGKQPKDVSVVPIYNNFLDIFTMLSATDPSKIPPFARIKLNQSIKRLGWIPDEVQISVKQNSLFRQAFSAKSTHVVIHQLSDNDRRRIANAKRDWMQFNSVELAEYRGLKTAPKFKLPKVATASHQEEINPESDR